MNIYKLLKTVAESDKKRALPILSFPAAQKLNVSVEDLVKNSFLQAKAMEVISTHTDTIAAVSLMDLSFEAEAFGADIRFSEDEVPALVGQLVSDEDEANALKVPSLEAGRAFEGAGISCGCSSIDGAIDKVTADIGLIPNELTDRTTILGNAALSGAIRVLLCPEEKQKLEGISELSEHINLGGNPKFNENYIEEMLFPE